MTETSLYEKRLYKIESILSGASRGSHIRADVTARPWTVLSKWVGGTGEENEGTAARKVEIATAIGVFEFIDKAGAY